MPRQIWVFAGRTVTSLVLSCRGSNIYCIMSQTRWVCSALLWGDFSGNSMRHWWTILFGLLFSNNTRWTETSCSRSFCDVCNIKESLSLFRPKFNTRRQILHISHLRFRREIRISVSIVWLEEFQYAMWQKDKLLNIDSGASPHLN